MPAISEIIGEALQRLGESPVAREAARTTEALKADVPPIPQNVPEAPYVGSEAARPFVRATAGKPPPTVFDWVDKLKTMVGSATTAEPNTAPSVAQMFLNARNAVADAQPAADRVLDERVAAHLGPTSMEQRTQGRILADYATRLSDYADLQSKLRKDPNGAYTGLGGATIDEVEKDLLASTNQVAKYPDVIVAHRAFRNMWDEAFALMKVHGYPVEYREQYTPMQKLEAVVKGVAQVTREDPGGILAAVRHRNSVGVLRETSVLAASRRALGDLYRKIAEDELAGNIFNDPTLDRTSEFQPGDRAPNGWTWYRPKPGLPGWKGGNEQEALVGAVDGLDPGARAGSPETGDRLIPQDLADRLRNFRPRKPSSGSAAANIGAVVSRWTKALTVLNPANIIGLHLPSDIGLSLLGRPGEQADPMGWLRAALSAYPESLKGAFGEAGSSPMYDEGVAAGLGKGTLVDSVTGPPMPSRLAAAAGMDVVQKNPYTNFMERLARAKGMAPRLAAATAARRKVLAAGGTQAEGDAEFARVGKVATLDYGAGAPALTRDPNMHNIAPFLTFMGGATKRVVDLLTTKGSRGRAWGLMAAVPVGTAMWNNHNQEFADAERQIPAYDRDALHFIVANGDGSVKRDPVTKLPVAVRFRYWVPEEVAHLFGMGNMPSRILAVARGYQSPGDLAGSIGTEAVHNIGGMIAPAEEVASLASGRNLLTGQEQPIGETLLSAIPVVSQTKKGIEAIADRGPVEGGKALAYQYLGVRFTGMSRADADLLDVNRQLKDMQSQIRSAQARGLHTKAAALMDEYNRLQGRIVAINAARRKARAQ